MRFRGKSIRRKIVALLLVPLVSLTAIWGFATVITGRQAAQLLDVSFIADKVGDPIEDTVRVLQDERRQTLVYLADPRASDALTDLRRKRAATDETVALARASAEDPDVREELDGESGERLASIVEAFDGIASLRRSVEDGPLTAGQALDLYNRLIDPCYTFLTDVGAIDDSEMDGQGRALVGLAYARELLAREDALVSAALATGTINGKELRQVSELVVRRTERNDISLEALPQDERRRYERFWKSPATAQLRAAEKTLLAADPGRPRGLSAEKTLLAADPGRPRGLSADSWSTAATGALDQLGELNSEAGDRLQDRVQPVAMRVLVQAAVAGVLGLVALLFSLFLSVRIGRSLVRDLNRLRKEAHEASGVRLPSVMRRLAAGEQVDVETEAPRLEYDRDEMGQVGQALNTLQRAAVEAAVKQADVRRGVSEVFVNLARRSQVLLHKQLTLLDSMERRTEDTEELADLFRLDHLTTRMRRHAEGLVILSGAAPSRQWRRPVQLMDVVRASVAEVEDYERIEVRRLPRVAVTGPAVSDVTHLVAELLENATVFSPPHTAVQVHGERVANGFTLEIHDRGLGMTAEALLDANLRLAETPDFELSDTDRLGLFVVSRLAQRQNVRVSLQKSPYGGTTAIVFIPEALLTEAVDTDGAGFRLDRGPDAPARRPADDRTGRPTEVPSRLPVLPPSILDGPVEIEPPVRAVDRPDEPATAAGDLTDEDSERGGLFRPRKPLVAGRREHQQADDPAAARREPTRSTAPADDSPVPLPRRRAPKLVSSHGRTVPHARTPADDPDDATPTGRPGPAADR
ncbi:HAMP domain-containing protein, partial [Streptomyces triticagri]